MKNNYNFLARYLPNTITLLSLCCGLSSIRYAIINDWLNAILLIILASIFDFFDGWFAKKLRGQGSAFGAELDSLSDVISFGVAPGLLIYLWSTVELGSLGWSISLFFAICAALRLARFTADLNLVSENIDSSFYFTGVPSPAAAGLSLLPIIIYNEFNLSFFQSPYFNIVNLLCIGFLMISKIPTISPKNLKFNRKYSAWIIILIVIMCVCLLSDIWKTLIVLGFLYFLSIIYTVFKHKNFS